MQMLKQAQAHVRITSPGRREDTLFLAPFDDAGPVKDAAERLLRSATIIILKSSQNYLCIVAVGGKVI